MNNEVYGHIFKNKKLVDPSDKSFFSFFKLQFEE